MATRGELLSGEELFCPFNEDYLRSGVDTFITDGDSTLFRIETGNTMLRANGVDGDEYTRREAGNGAITFRDSFTARYNAGKLSQDQVVSFGSRLHQYLSVGATETISALQSLNISVHLVSGAIQQALEGITPHLPIQRDNIHAIPLWFHDDDSYAGFDPDHPLLDDEGKARTAERIVEGRQRWCFVGDGHGEKIAVEKAKTIQKGLCIAFAGIAEREWMRIAPIKIMTPNYCALLPLVVGRERWPNLLRNGYQSVLLEGMGHTLNGQVVFREDYTPYYQTICRFVETNGLQKEIEAIIAGGSSR